MIDYRIEINVDVPGSGGQSSAIILADNGAVLMQVMAAPHIVRDALIHWLREGVAVKASK